MEYSIDYQYMPKNASRPHDDGAVVGIKANSESGLVILPNVGDFVHIDNSADGGERVSFSGEVRSRAFFYTRTSNGKVFCSVNIVVAESDVNWGTLIKE